MMLRVPCCVDDGLSGLDVVVHWYSLALLAALTILQV